MARTNTSSVSAFGMKDRLGYMFGDFGNDFTFILSSMFIINFIQTLWAYPQELWVCS